MPLLQPHDTNPLLFQPQITHSKRDVEVAFDFFVDVAVEGVALTTPNLSPQLQSDTAGIDSYISACKCDSFASFTCDESALAPDAVLNVCISSVNAEVEIQVVKNFDLFQGDAVVNETMDVIRDSVLVNSGISDLDKKNDSAWMVATQCPASIMCPTSEQWGMPRIEPL